MTTLKLTEAVIRAGAVEKSFQRGRELYRSSVILNAAIQGNILSGDCEGTESPFYKVRAELDGGGLAAESQSRLRAVGANERVAKVFAATERGIQAAARAASSVGEVVTS